MRYAGVAPHVTSYCASWASAFMLVVAGCAQIPRASVVGEQEQISIVDRPPPIPNGSIYQARQGYQPFEDRRPRSVGDILTIVLDEEVSASKNSQSNAGVVVVPALSLHSYLMRLIRSRNMASMFLAQMILPAVVALKPITPLPVRLRYRS